MAKCLMIDLFWSFKFGKKINYILQFDYQPLFLQIFL
jgi:hypothetical protein